MIKTILKLEIPVLYPTYENNDVKINGFKDALKSMELVFKSYKDNK